MKLARLMTIVALAAAVGIAVLIYGPAGEAADEKAGNLVSARVDKGPNLDGKADDPAWAKAKALEIEAKRPLPPNVGASVKVTLKSVHTDSEIYFLAVWDDPTEDITHKTWVWNKEKKAYEEGADREDMFSLVFEHTGSFTTDMLAGVESTWDVWHWKAFRTNPQGFAMDKLHRYMLSKPEGKAKEYKAKNDKPLWISRPEDAGDTVEVRVPAPTEYKTDRVPQYVPGKPTGSAADVKAKGAWAGKKWTLELGRKLNTGHKDDTAFDTGRTYKMALAVFDKTGDMDKGSGVIELSFGK